MAMGVKKNNDRLTIQNPLIYVRSVATAIFLSGVVLFSAPIPVQANALRCSKLFSDGLEPVLVSKPTVYGQAHLENVLENSTDGPQHLNPSLEQWGSDQDLFNSRVLPSSENSVEPILELSGAYGREVKDYRIQAKDLVYGPTNLGSTSGYGNSSGVSIKISVQDPLSEIKMYFRSNDRVIYEVTLPAPRHPTTFYIPWSDFKVSPLAKNKMYDPVANVLFNEDSFGFLVKPIGSVKPKGFAFRIHGPIAFERDILGDSELLNKLLLQRYDPAQATTQVTRGMSYHKELKFKDSGRTSENDKIVLMKAINNYHDIAKQNFARKMTDVEAIEAIKKLGFVPIIMREKIDTAEFFGNVTNTIAKTSVDEISDFEIDEKHRPKIPIETGSFALDHGSTSHARQLIAMCNGLSLREIETLKGIIASFSGPNSHRWPLWDILFDSAGIMFPNSPRFWRND